MFSVCEEIDGKASEEKREKDGDEALLLGSGGIIRGAGEGRNA